MMQLCSIFYHNICICIFLLLVILSSQYLFLNYQLWKNGPKGEQSVTDNVTHPLTRQMWRKYLTYNTIQLPIQARYSIRSGETRFTGTLSHHSVQV